jgi:hypothetical protein
MQNLDVDRRNNVEVEMSKWSEEVWIGFIWLRTEVKLSAVLLVRMKLGSVTGRHFLTNSQLWPSQELRSLETVLAFFKVIIHAGNIVTEN